MKKKSMWAVAAGAAMTLLTSCLGETTNSQKLSGIPGVVYLDDLTGTKTLVDIGSFPIYSSTLENKFMSNDCVISSFEIDYSSPENANASTLGYYNVALSDCQKVDSYNMLNITSPQDTATVLTNELPVEAAVNNLYMHSYVRGYQFLWPTIKMKEDQKIEWRLYANMSNIEAGGTENDYNYYSMFLRAVETRPGEGSDEVTTLYPAAFYIKNFVERANSIEVSNNKDFYLIRVYYIEKIGEDKKPVWKYNTIQMQTVKDS